VWLAALQVPHTPHGVLHRPSGISSALLDSVPALISKSRPPDRSVALIDGADFHRETDADAIDEAYRRKHRTRVFEHIGFYGGVLLPVIARLSELAGGKVACSAYQSRAGDRSFGPHVDDWLGVILQVDGKKLWRIWGRDGVRELTTRQGDILAIPKDVKHDVSTPSTPGHSVHITFAFMGGDA
jgi:hypothetical protein